MRIGIQTWGSRGDMAPFLALAAGLSRAGHAVTLALTDVDRGDYSRFAARHGFSLREVGYGLAPHGASAEAAARAALRLRHPVRQYARIAEAFFRPAEAAMFAAAQELCRENELVIGHHIHHPLAAAAELSGTPRIGVVLAPGGIPTRTVRPQGAPSLGPLDNLLVPLWWKIARAIVNRAVLPDVNRLRASVGLAPQADALAQAWLSPLLTLVAASPTLCPAPPDWPASVRVCGFFEMPTPEAAWPVDPALEAFLAGGPEPVYLGMGSLTPRTEAEKTALFGLFAAAAAKCGRRAMIQALAEDAADAGRFRLPPHALLIGPSPHAPLFPRCAAIVHHGGAGTTHAAALAGRPQVVVAHMTDQFYWGEILARQGLAPRHIPRGKLTAGALAERLATALGSAAMREATRVCGVRMRTEDGVGAAVAAVEGLGVKVGRAGNA